MGAYGTQDGLLYHSIGADRDIRQAEPDGSGGCLDSLIDGCLHSARQRIC